MDDSRHLFFQGRTPSPPAPAPRSRRPDPLPDPAAEEFLTALFRQAGLGLDHYRPGALRRRLPACLRRLRVATLAEARRRLAAEPVLVAAALDAILLGVTGFHRDPPVFAAVTERVIPALAAEPGPLRIWSAACSDGHELYSMAILLGEAGRRAETEFLGTDVRAEAVAGAQRGRFSAEEVEALPPALRARHFVAEDGQWRAEAGLRAALRWRRADLLAEAACGPWNAILWRNMAIYLQPRAAEEIWARLCGQLAPGGFLITGKAEYPSPGLPLARVAACIFRKEPGP